MVHLIVLTYPIVPRLCPVRVPFWTLFIRISYGKWTRRERNRRGSIGVPTGLTGCQRDGELVISLYWRNSSGTNALEAPYVRGVSGEDGHFLPYHADQTSLANRVQSPWDTGMCDLGIRSSSTTSRLTYPASSGDQSSDVAQFPSQ